MVKAGLVKTGAKICDTSGVTPVFHRVEAINQIQAFVANRRSEEFAEGVADGLYDAHQNHKFTVEQMQ